ncbi:MAG TPA: translation initiation factor IF-2 N-terminal domain-containing protein [Candidatus Corynebacterium avicola]|uniref:Ribonuclease E n=1 Tax=Candidatus Corynebacterium avicola TaxID=2838527 RepID=A0A9D1UM54_9CORY|nr:translation initiation factor IF-2 N-terminal domain-containing protein [Candidatus Corynebacterium avicola]
MGEKVRVHALAKALGVTSAQLITVLAENGIENKRAASTLPKSDVEAFLGRLSSADEAAEEEEGQDAPVQDAPATRSRRSRRRRTTRPAAAPQEQVAEEQIEEAAEEPATEPAQEQRKVVRRRVVRRVGSRSAAHGAEQLRREKEQERANNSRNGDGNDDGESSDSTTSGGSRRRRGSRGRGRGRSRQNDNGNKNADNAANADNATSDADSHQQEAANAEPKPPTIGGKDTKGVRVVDEPVKLKGSTRLESKRRWREAQGNEKRRAVSRAEFIARRENIYRSMVVRDSQRTDHDGTVTQVGVVEDGLLVEHFVTSETQTSTIGNIYLGRVQNVLASMEAAFIDIGTGRNAVLYASEVDWRSEHIRGRSRRIESALKQGDQVLVQVIKDPLGHKGARLTNRVSFAGRYLVYLPGGKTQGISRKLPESERKRLKGILGRVVPDGGGTIIRTAAEGVSEEKIAEDVDRLHRRWIDITEREQVERDKKGARPVTMYEEPNLLVKIVRDMFNEDFNELVVDGGNSSRTVLDYIERMAPDLVDKVVTWDRDAHDGQDAFDAYELDAQLTAALSQKVWLPSGGYLIIDKTEAMTVIDVNTGSFVGSGGNLEETVTKNNLEAAEEIVRQMRLRDMGGMIVVDFIDMVLEENQDLVLRRLQEYLVSDRTKHKVSEVTSLGLVQMTRKRLGVGLLETYTTECEACSGRGVIVHDDPVEHVHEVDGDSNASDGSDRGDRDGKGGRGSRHRDHHSQADREGLKQARHEQEIRRRYEQMMEENAATSLEETPETTGVVPSAENPESAESPDTGQDRPRRVRRRVVRRGRAQDAPAAEKKADRERKAAQDTSSVSSDSTADEGVSDDLESIISRAISYADEIDPEEPSGADYVDDYAADHPDDDAEAEVEAAASAPVATSVRRDRRGRRVVRRITETPEPAPSESEAEATEAPEAAEPTDSLSQYRQARQEFDRSPRRRRKVRGNSRSDVAPAPEDFGLDAEDEGVAEIADAAKSDDSGKATSSGAAGRSRGRAKAQAADDGDTAAAAAPAAETGASDTAGQRRGRRGRRKVVRTSSR